MITVKGIMRLNPQRFAIPDQAVRRNLSELMEDMDEGIKQPPPAGSPHDTGNNASSVEIHPFGALGFTIETTSGYGGWLDFGTTRMPGRPYFGPNFIKAARIMFAKPPRAWE